MKKYVLLSPKITANSQAVTYINPKGEPQNGSCLPIPRAIGQEIFTHLMGCPTDNAVFISGGGFKSSHSEWDVVLDLAGFEKNDSLYAPSLNPNPSTIASAPLYF